MDTNKTEVIGGSVLCFALIAILALASLFDCNQVQNERDSQLYGDSVIHAFLNE